MASAAFFVKRAHRRARSGSTGLIIKSGGDRAAQAAFNLGHVLERQGRIRRATAAYQMAIDSGHQEWAPAAAVNLGKFAAERGDFKAARAAWQYAIDSGHSEYAPTAALNLGIVRGREGDVPGAEAAYRRAAGFGHPELAAAAANNLGGLLLESGRPGRGRVRLPGGDRFRAPRVVR